MPFQGLESLPTCEFSAAFRPPPSNSSVFHRLSPHQPLPDSSFSASSTALANAPGDLGDLAGGALPSWPRSRWSSSAR